MAKKQERMTAGEVLTALNLVKNKSSTAYASKLAALHNFVQASTPFNSSVTDEITSINQAGEEFKPDKMRLEMIQSLLNTYEWHDEEVIKLRDEKKQLFNAECEQRERLRKTKKKDPSDIETEIERLSKDGQELQFKIEDLIKKQEEKLNRQLFSVEQMRERLMMYAGVRVKFTTDTGRYSFLLPTGTRFYNQMCGVLKLPLPNMVKKEEKKIKYEIMCYDILMDQIKVASKFVSDDDLRPVMQCVCLDFNKKGVQVVATDAHRLYMSKRWECEIFTHENGVRQRGVGKDFQLIIQQCSMVKLLKSKIDRLELCKVILYDDGTGEINNTPVIFFTDVKYPDYKVVVPKYTEYVEFYRKDFIQAISQAMVYSNRSTNQVALDINGEIMMHAQDVDFDFESSVRMNFVKKTLPDTLIAFNAKFLKDSLSIFKEDTVKMYSDGVKTHAGIFTNDIDRILIMPLMLHQ